MRYIKLFLVINCEAQMRPKSSCLRFRHVGDVDTRWVHAQYDVGRNCMGQIRPSFRTRRRIHDLLLGHAGGTRFTL